MKKDNTEVYSQELLAEKIFSKHLGKEIDLVYGGIVKDVQYIAEEMVFSNFITFIVFYFFAACGLYQLSFLHPALVLLLPVFIWVGGFLYSQYWLSNAESEQKNLKPAFDFIFSSEPPMLLKQKFQNVPLEKKAKILQSIFENDDVILSEEDKENLKQEKDGVKLFEDTILLFKKRLWDKKEQCFNELNKGSQEEIKTRQDFVKAVNQIKESDVLLSAISGKGREEG